MSDDARDKGSRASHQTVWLAAGLRRAAREAGVRLPVAYSQQVAVDGLAHCEQLGVTRAGTCVVIHTAPDSPRQLPIVVGWADAAGQWYSDGRQHGAGGPAAPVEASASEVTL